MVNNIKIHLHATTTTILLNNSPCPTNMDPNPEESCEFLFPNVRSAVLPDPSCFFSPNLLSSPLPTNSFFQNFVLQNGDQAEYIHPYLIKSANSSLSICYPCWVSNSTRIYQAFVADITISTTLQTSNSVSCFGQKPPSLSCFGLTIPAAAAVASNNHHIISSFSDLSVTLDLPPNLRFHLVRGSPFLTCVVSKATNLSISTVHAILSLSSNPAKTKHTIKLNNTQTWLCYTSSRIKLTTHNASSSMLTCKRFSGIIRFAVLPGSNPVYETTLDQFSSCYPVSGNALFTKLPFSLEYKWEKKGRGDLLLLAHPLHLQLLSSNDCEVTVLEGFKYRSIDGDLVGVIGDSWVLKTELIPVTWHSIRGVDQKSFPEIVSSLVKDVEDLNSTPITTTASYYYGKAIARAARLALIAEEVCCTEEVIPTVSKFLKDAIEPWLDGSFKSNSFFYDPNWGGIVTKLGLANTREDFGFGIYNDHHFQLGHFLYGIAVLNKIDPVWGKKYRPQAYSLMADFMNLGRKLNLNYPRLRSFDLWKLHSWAGGLEVFWDGRNQESTSEAVNAYYSGALMGLSYEDTGLVALGSTLAAFEILAAQTWWHVREGDIMYEEEFTKQNRVMGVLWANKRDSGLWFARADWRECRLGIQVLPLLPITEVLFSDVGFVRELVNWTLPALARKGAREGWKGFVYALEGVYDKQGALEKIRKLKEHEEGNSLTNLLWWIHSRVDEDDDEGCATGGK